MTDPQETRTSIFGNDCCLETDKVLEKLLERIEE